MYKKAAGVFVKAGIISASLLLINCSGEKINSPWTDNEIKVDGNNTDWQNINVNYNKDSEVLYGIANNATNLYAIIYFRNKGFARRIMHSGLNLWLNGDNSKDKVFGIRFASEMGMSMPYSPEGDYPRPERWSSDRRGPDDFRGEGPGLEMEFKGDFYLLNDSDTLAIPATGLDGIEVAAGYVNDVYCLEYKVPVASLGIGDKKHMSMKAGIEIPEIRTHHKRDRSSAGGGFNVGFGGREGGGMGGPGGGRGGGPDGPREGESPNRSAFQEVELWYTVSLAQSANVH